MSARATALLLMATLLVGCGLDEERARRLESLVLAVEAPADWVELESGNATFEDAGFTTLSSLPFCSAVECLAASRRWRLPAGMGDAAAIDALVDATPGWDVVHAPDCHLVPDPRGDLDPCMWEADAGDEYVLVRLDPSVDRPWEVRASAHADDHVRRGEESPVVRARRRAVAAPLLAMADAVAVPGSWRVIDDEVLADPDDCDELACLSVLRTWFDAPPPTAEELVALLRDAGLGVADVDGDCGADSASTRPEIACTIEASSPVATAVLTSMPVTDVHEVRLVLTPR